MLRNVEDVGHEEKVGFDYRCYSFRSRVRALDYVILLGISCT